jgi:hypothetical protein
MSYFVISATLTSLIKIRIAMHHEQEFRSGISSKFAPPEQWLYFLPRFALVFSGHWERCGGSLCGHAEYDYCLKYHANNKGRAKAMAAKRQDSKVVFASVQQLLRWRRLGGRVGTDAAGSSPFCSTGGAAQIGKAMLPILSALNLGLYVSCCAALKFHLGC